jgi:hypothetical protein
MHAARAHGQLMWPQPGPEFKTQEVEVQTARKEAERIAALNAMANLKIAEGWPKARSTPSWCLMTSRGSSTPNRRTGQ